MWSNLMSIDVVSHFTNIRLLADIFNRSSSFDQLNYGDVLMLSETGFTHKFLRQQIDDVISKCEWHDYVGYVQKS